MDNPHSLSIIVPCYNEEDAIVPSATAIISILHELCIEDYEIILVDDGSRDNTVKNINAFIESNPTERLKIVRHHANLGLGAAFWTGVDNAKKSVVTWTPGDNENNPKEIIQYIRMIDFVDVVVPFVFNFDVRSKKRQIISKTFLNVMNFLFNTRFNYTNGPALYRREVLSCPLLRSRSFFFQARILIVLSKLGYLFAEVPIKLSIRMNGTASALKFKNVIKLSLSTGRLIFELLFQGRKTLKKHNIVNGTATQYRRMVE